MKNLSLLFLVLLACDAYCGVIENIEEPREEIEARQENISPELEDNAEPEGRDVVEEAPGNSPLLYDTNIAHHSPENPAAVKHKRCPSGSRLGSSLKPTILGAKAPQSVERRDIQSQFYGRLCNTCLTHNACTLITNCPVCEAWCSKAAQDGANGPTPDSPESNNVVGSAPERASPEAPIISLASRSNFEDHGRKNVYTITTLRTGSTKEMILRLLGVSDIEDIDTVVIWVTTHSNHPPVTAKGIQVTVDPEAEKLAETVKDELKSALQEKIQQHGKEFLTNGGDELDKVIRGVLSKMRPSSATPESNQADNLQTVGSRSNMESEILPRYPVDPSPDGFLVPQTLNPDIIEGPPDVRALNSGNEMEDPVNLGATNYLAEEEMPDQDMQSLGTQQEIINSPTNKNQEFVEEKIAPLYPPAHDANQGKESDFKNLNMDVISNDVREGPKPVDENQLGTSPNGNMEPTAPLNEGLTPVDNTGASSRNVSPNQRGAIQRGESGSFLKSGSNPMETISRPNIGRGMGNRGTQFDIPNNQRSGIQQDKVGSSINEAEMPASLNGGKIPLLDRMRTLNPQTRTNEMMERLRAKTIQLPQSFQRFAGRREDDAVGSENTGTGLASELDKKENPENLNARSLDHGHIHNHVHGHNQGGHGTIHNHGQGHGHGHIHNHGHFHRSNEPDESQMMDFQNGDLGDSNGFVSQQRTSEREPQFENGVLSKNAAVDQELSGLGGVDPENIQTGSNTVPAELGPKAKSIPVKFNVGARANELIQRLKEKQEQRRVASTLQKTPVGTSRQGFIDSTRPVDSLLNSGTQQESSMVKSPSPSPGISNFDNAEAALGKVMDVAKELQKDATSIVSPGDNINTMSGNDKISSDSYGPDRVGSEPIENSWERIQPTMSRSGRPWRNQKVGSSLADEQPNEPMEPSLGSSYPASDMNNQNQDEPAEVNTSIQTSGQFDSSQNAISASNSMGAIIPGENPIDMSFQKPSDVYFLGNGIKLPLKMVREKDGAVHLTVDLDKLCSCNNITCPKNHTVLEKAVETMLENETELKQQLDPVADSEPIPRLESRFSEDPIEGNGDQRNLEDSPVGMARQHSLFEDDTSNLPNPEDNGRFQSRMGEFDEEAMRDSLPHRNERDTVEESNFLNMKNKIASKFDSMELQSDNADIWKRSPDMKVGKLESELATHADNAQRQMNRNKIDSIEKVGQKTTKNMPPESEATTVENLIKPSMTTQNYLQDFMSKRMEEMKSTMSNFEKINKELSFPQSILKDLWTAGKKQAGKLIKTIPSLSTDDNAKTSPNMESRLGDFFGKAKSVNDEIFDNLVPINKPYKFRALENQLKTNLEHIDDTINNYTKQDENIITDESAALQKINENPVIRKEVGIVSNLLKFFKDVATDKNKKK